MLPAVLFFAGIDVLKGNLWPDLLKRVSYLTMMANFAYPFVKCSPGVYWYFGLTFQFYLLWAFLGKHFNWKNLLVWSLFLLAGLYGFSAYGSSESLSIFRHCFTGWFPVFAIGVWLGISKNGDNVAPKKSIWLELLLFVVFFALIVLFSKRMISWVFIPIIALGWFIVIGLMLMRTRYLSEIFRWVGKYSACIFVCHPIARLIVNNAVLPRLPNLLVVVLIYVVLTIGIALLYDKLYKWILDIFIHKTA